MKTVTYTVTIPEDLKKEAMQFIKKMKDEKNQYPRGTQEEIIRAGLDALKGEEV